MEHCYSLNKNVSELPLYDYDIKEIPDFETRAPYTTGTVFMPSDPNLADALRLNKEEIMAGYVEKEHNSLYYVPYEENKTAHSEWFSAGKDKNTGLPYQLCYSRDPDGMVETAIEGVKKVVESKPDVSIVTFICEDNRQWCGCDSCKSSKEKYGCDSAAYIMFLNKLAETAHKWAKSELNREIYICGMAYQATEKAPARYDEQSGKYVPINEDVVFSPYLCIEYAPINCDYYVSFDDKVNEDDMSALNSWHALSDKLFLWIYNQADFNDYMIFYDNFSSMQRNYKILASVGTLYLLDQGQFNNENSTAFNSLRLYLASKLAWNCNADYAALTDKYFKGYFGAAEKPMREIFEALRNRYAMLYKQGIINEEFRGYACKEVYPEGFVKYLLAKIDEAYAAIETVKGTDRALYEALYDRICLESVSFRYIEIYVYSKTFTQEVLKNKVSSLKDDCTRFKITQWGEHKKISELWELYA